MEERRGRMGSRIMHYCISSLLSRCLDFHDSSFLLGGIAPDLHSYMGPSHYHLTHFSRRDENGNTQTDYSAYIGKYLTGTMTSFHLGYFFHLISDDIWKKEIYYKKVKGLPPEEREEALGKNYRDFWRLNGQIIDYHSLQLETLRPFAPHMDEIDPGHFPQLIAALHGDFERKNEVDREELEFLDFWEVLAVIDQSVKTCLDAYDVLIASHREQGQV